MATKLSERIKSTVIVENRPGAGGTLGTDIALKSAPDGYTLLLVAGSYTVNPSLYKLSFDPIGDMTPVIQLSRGAYVLVVHPSVPARTLPELLALMRSDPGKYTFASSGMGGHLHVVTEYLFDLAKVKGTHVPYKGTGPAISDLLGGQVQMMFAGTEGVMQHVKSGKLRALAVGTAKRLAAFPDIPSAAEAVPGYDVVAWHGLVAPKGVPAAVIDYLNREINATLSSKGRGMRRALDLAVLLPKPPARARPLPMGADSSVGAEHHPAFEHRRARPHLGQLARRQRGRRLLEHDEVGRLAHRQRSGLVLEPERARGLRGEQRQRLRQRDRLVLADRALEQPERVAPRQHARQADPVGGMCFSGVDCERCTSCYRCHRASTTSMRRSVTDAC